MAYRWLLFRGSGQPASDSDENRNTTPAPCIPAGRFPRDGNTDRDRCRRNSRLYRCPRLFKLYRQDEPGHCGKDIAIIVQSIEQYFLENKAFPNSPDDIGLGTKLDPWDNTYYYYLRISGANLNGKGKLRKDGSLNPINSDYDLYSAGKDGQTKLPLRPPVSHDDILRASNGRFIGYAADF